MSKTMKRILIVVVVLVLGAVALHFASGSMRGLGRAIHGAPSGR